MNNPNELLTVANVAEKLNVSTQYVRSLMRKNELTAIKLGSQWVISADDIDTYIKRPDVILEPRDHPRKSNSIPDIVALSFFSGAMGLDIGLKKSGINALLACENNKPCRMTIETNNQDIALIGDINKYSAKEILKMANISSNQKVDVIFGGPPCQAFSTAGCRRGFDDERGNVFLKYLDIINDIKPKYVVIENVRGLLSVPYPCRGLSSPIKGGALCVILDRLEKMGYAVSFNLYNAANFGAPQIRERVVIIGKLGKTKVPYLIPTHSDDQRYGLLPWRTFGEAVCNIPTTIEHHYIKFPEKRLKYYRMLKEGQYWKDLPYEIQPEAMGRSYKLGGGKTGFYRRLSFNKPSPTLVTNPTMPATDLCHPTENRPLSVEEYKYVQEFPSEWRICGSILEQYKQIGNAVPIKLGEAIGKAIIDDMNQKKNLPIGEFSYSRYKNTDELTWKNDMNQKLEKVQNSSD